jgi:hypothetical protein
MKTISLFFLTFLLCSFTFKVNGQVTAVMQARVQVIAGAGLSSISENIVDLNTVSTFGNFEAGSFTLTTSPGSEVNVRIANSSQFVNEEGKELKLDEITAQRQTINEGELLIAVNGKITALDNVSGRYSGTVTTIIEYY